MDFGFSTVGFGADLVLSYTTRGTATGFNAQDWSYSTDGVNYTSFSTIGGITTSFAIKTIDFSAAGLAGQSNVHIRVTFNGATNTGGNNRLDNVQFNATAIPAPGALALFGLDPVADARRFHVSPQGVVLVSAEMLARRVPESHVA